jgi:hypothetical protein
MGGVFNVVNLHTYHYAGNNPVKYIDPDGNYDRQAAVAYATQWATARNPGYYSYRTDCANFVSQSLSAGGIRMTGSWHSYSETSLDDFGLYSMQHKDWDVTLSWSKVQELFDYFSDPQKGYSDGMVTVDKNNLSAVANNGEVQVGDIIIFAGKNGDTHHHAAIVTGIKDGEISFSAHTNSREDAKLSKHIGNEQVIIIKMKNEAE